jgi:hypothetical protein
MIGGLPIGTGQFPPTSDLISVALTVDDLLDRLMRKLRLQVTDGTQRPRVLEVLDEVYRDVALRHEWAWLYRVSSTNTLPEYTDGTATVVHGSSDIVLAPAPTSVLGDFVGRVFIPQGSVADPGVLYQIIEHDAGTALISISSLYNGETQGDLTFRIYHDAYALPLDMERLIAMRRFGEQLSMKRIGPQEMFHLKSHDMRVGKPEVYSVFDHEVTGQPRTAKLLHIHPYPDKAYRIEILYKQSVRVPLTETTPLFIPDSMVQVLLYGSLEMAYPIIHNDIERGMVYGARFKDVLNLMVASHRYDETPPRMVVQDDYRRFYQRRRPSGGRGDLGKLFDRWPVD